MFSITKSHPKKGIWHRIDGASAKPGPGDVAVEVTKAGICGTDFHIYTWDAWSAGRVRPPLTLGHEFVGRIAAIGAGVRHLKQGQRVSAECHVTCGVCVHCRTGNAHVCATVEIIGVDRPGCFAEIVIVPAENVWLVADSIPDSHAAVFDPVGNAMHAVSQTTVSGQDVLVMGGGPIGLFAAAIARSYGARSVAVIEPNRYRGQIARRLGADLVVAPGDDDLADRVRGMAGGLGPSVLLEMSGSATALRTGLRLLRNGSEVALLGLPSQPVELELSETVIMRGLTLRGITGRRMFDTWFRVQSFMERNPRLMDEVVTHVIPATKYGEGFELMERGECGKVVLDFAALQDQAA